MGPRCTCIICITRKCHYPKAPPPSSSVNYGGGGYYGLDMYGSHRYWLTCLQRCCNC
uniref:Uncharacterized protein n=1 Tax=Anguilla anguilla TaxID=7936 RepID=A0A0E9VX43_ANGAN